MVALKLERFGGMIPAVDDDLLPQNNAALSENAWVYSGAIEGFKRVTPVHTLVNPLARKVFRIPTQYYDKDHIQDSFWMEFPNADVDVIQSPTVDDQFERFYWCGVGEEPQYNTKTRILAGQAPYKLGIPAPTVAPTVSRQSGKYYLQASTGVFRTYGGVTRLYHTAAYTNDTGSLGSGGVDDIAYEQFGSTRGISSTRGNLDASPTPVPTESPKNLYAVSGKNVEMRYTTLVAGERITISDTGEVTKGVPAQPNPATSTDPYEGLGVAETRAYVYTWVSAYGEESPPSPPTLYDGWSEDPWVIGVTPPGSSVTTDRNIEKVRIYRTVTGAGGATTFFYVTEMPIADITFTDDEPSTKVAANNILESTFWTPPPDDLVGFVTMPNGIIAGWRKNEIWFCEPYRPHAWPAPYTLAVEPPVVGLGVIGQSLIVCTSGAPYAISGINPGAMTLSRITSTEACLSRGSIISTPNGVAYASPNGIVMATPAGVQVVTSKIISKDLWLDTDEYVSVSTLRAASLNGGYYAWGSVSSGCFEDTAFDPDSFLFTDFTGAQKGVLIDPTDDRVAYTKLTSLSPTYNCFADPWTGEVFLIREGRVEWMDITNTRPRDGFRWRSKVFETPNQRNFEAMRIYFSQFTDIRVGPFASGLWDDDLYWTDAGYWYDTPTPDFGVARVYADDRLVFTRALVRSGDLFRLPSGFKATFWQVEVETSMKISSIEIATTAKELGSV